MHPGNVQFREWVRVRKNDYNLAPNKAEKAKVAQEVIALVKSQDPPGRFLQKDPSSGYGANGFWVQVDDDKIMAKTSQALREGAPKIRAEHRDELEENRLKFGQASRHKKTVSMDSTTPTTPEKTTTVEDDTNVGTSPGWKRVLDERRQKDAIDQLRVNAEAAAADLPLQTPPSKRVRVMYQGNTVRPNDATPPMVPVSPPLFAKNDAAPLLPKIGLPKDSSDGLKRTHSLAFSEGSVGDWATEEFVNPFDDEVERRLLQLYGKGEPNENINHAVVPERMSLMPSPLPSPPRPGISNNGRRTSSASSHGDMGGLGALLQQQPLSDSNRSLTSSSSNTSNSGVRRHRKNNNKLSSRYVVYGAEPTTAACLQLSNRENYEDHHHHLQESLHGWDLDEALRSLPVNLP